MNSSAIARSAGVHDDSTALRPLSSRQLVTRQELLDLHRIVGERLGRRVDRREAAADDHDGQSQLHVRERILFRRPGELQRHQEIGRGAHTLREAVRQLEHRRPAGAGGERHVIEPERERAFGVDRAAEAHAAVHREALAPLDQQAQQLEEVLVPANGDAVLGHTAEPGHHPIVERLGQRRDVADRHERHALAVRGDAGHCRRERLDLQPVDADDRVTVVQQMMCERESRRSHADDEHALAGGRRRDEATQVERIPSSEQPVDLESPRQRKHVLQQARFRLRDVDRIGILVDARLHAVVADPMPGARDHRVVDADHRECADRDAFGSKLVELRDALLQRAAGERDAERRLPERNGERCAVALLLLRQAFRTRVLALLVAPDAVVRFVQRGRQVHAAIGQLEAVAAAAMIVRQLGHLDAESRLVHDRNEPHVVELARRPEKHAALADRRCLRRLRGPRGVAHGDVERRCVAVLVLAPPDHRVRERELALDAIERGAHQRFELLPEARAVEACDVDGLVAIHRLALDERALHCVQRRELVMARLQRQDFRFDPEKMRDEVLDVRRDGDQELGLRFRRK